MQCAGLWTLFRPRCEADVPGSPSSQRRSPRRRSSSRSRWPTTSAASRSTPITQRRRTPCIRATTPATTGPRARPPRESSCQALRRRTPRRPICYGSNIDKNPAAAGQSALIGDGNSDSRFRTVETEQNMVSPAGKSPDDQWPVKPGNVHAKDDFSHAYTHASAVDSPVRRRLRRRRRRAASRRSRGRQRGQPLLGLRVHEERARRTSPT